MNNIYIEYQGINVHFILHEGIIRGYHKYVLSSSNVSGGSGKISTDIFTGKISGRIKPITTSIEHKFITEFVIAGKDELDIPVRIVNESKFFVDGQRAVAWIEAKTNRIFKIVNLSTGEETIITPLKRLFKQNNHYFEVYLRHNPITKFIWYFIKIACISWSILVITDIIRHKTDLLGIIIAIVALLIAVWIYRFTYRIIIFRMAWGINKGIKNHKI